MSGVEFLPLVAIALLFWLLIIRPQSRRQKELQRLQSALAVGDEVMLTSGIFGTVVETGDAELHVEVAEGVRLRVARAAVATLQRPEGLEGPGTTPTHDPEEH